SQNSSNSQRLREVAVDAGARAGYLVDFAREIHEEWVAEAGTVGVTSGASVPDDLVMEVLDWLAERGFSDVTEVTTAQEKLFSSSRQKIRPDRRAAPASRDTRAAAATRALRAAPASRDTRAAAANRDLRAAPASRDTPAAAANRDLRAAPASRDMRSAAASTG